CPKAGTARHRAAHPMIAAKPASLIFIVSSPLPEVFSLPVGPLGHDPAEAFIVARCQMQSRLIIFATCRKSLNIRPRDGLFSVRPARPTRLHPATFSPLCVLSTVKEISAALPRFFLASGCKRLRHSPA